MRVEAKNDFEKDFWKLLINIALGKCMENLRTKTIFFTQKIEETNGEN